ncbi:hypothetical protein SCUCBS95973_003659 [Sporothrix curviconia]|uniref:Aminoglycoside phosphotransferase domain-containing protein n=1 Tax=Sporothrix curviconia TaxID=1260050 RepID=A0ABP0BHA2_9PEZI
MDERDVVPDEAILAYIFGASHEPTSTTLVLQTWEKCVFRADFDNGEPSCFVRMEAKDSDPPPQLGAVSALQAVAAHYLPGLVPKMLKTGVGADAAVNKQGRRFEFSVMAFAEGETLEAVWDDLSLENQQAIVAELSTAVQTLHKVRLEDPVVQDLLAGPVPAASTARLGCLSTGFVADGEAFLIALGQKWELKDRHLYDIDKIDASDGDDGFFVFSAFDGIPPVTVRTAHLEQWPHEAVFCHNDLSPRNIIVQTTTVGAGKPWYRVSGLIDWEMAGFYPPAYELALHDKYLGTANMQASFYGLLRRELLATVFVERTLSQTSLLGVLQVFNESRQRRLYDGLNIPAHIRRRFLDRLGLTQDADLFVGWVARDTETTKDGTYPSLSHAEVDALIQDVIQEVQAKR